MNNPFFTALEGDGFSASELAEQTKKVLTPFRHYLNNSIEALKKKEVSCHWKPVGNQRYRLTPNKRIYQVFPQSEIEIIPEGLGWHEILGESDGTLLENTFTPNTNAPVEVGKGADWQQFPLAKDEYQFVNGQHKVYLPKLIDTSVIQWSGYQLNIRPMSVSLDALKEVHIDSNYCQIISVQGDRLNIQGQVNSNSALSINGQNTRFNLITSLNVKQLENYFPQRKENSWLLFSSEKPSLPSHQVRDVTNELLGELSPAHLIQTELSLHQEKLVLNVVKGDLILEAQGLQAFEINNEVEVRCKLYSELSFNINKDTSTEKWIQLIEKQSGDDTGKSDLDYFFDDHIKVLDNTQRKYDDGFRVLRARPEERQLLLARDTRGKKNWKSEYPSTQNKVSEIRVSIDISQLNRQKEAVNQLMSRPCTEHTPLVHLLQGRERKRWKEIELETDIDWQVLTNPDFDGCDRQREFVTKALATTDFAILDGPPGTGKTTTILELIIQLVMQGKRVLLSASTHAAINNVLERVQESATLRNHIFPLRIGNESSAIGVESFQFDRLYEQLKKDSNYEGISKQLMVDASNLVCGTTIGILRLFNEKDVILNRGIPPFDVMIIDECSKTTFQEFLVPARFAKRWILVGDVRQLSPFTDREQIVANLDNLMLVPSRGKTAAKTLSQSVQEACFLLEELRGNTDKNTSPYQQPMLVPVTASVLQALQDEIAERHSQKKLSIGLGNILLIKNGDIRGSAYSWLMNIATIKQEPWNLYKHSLCFVDEACMLQIQPMIPNDMLVLHTDWERMGGAFRHKADKQVIVKPFKVKTADNTSTNKIQTELLKRFSDTKWSEEICWRLEREYWLRLSENYQKKTGYLSETLERLFPKSVNADGRIHLLKNIAFPSILEALSGDGLAKLSKDEPTTLNQGFRSFEKSQRHSTLSYQHRMHPDISAFPRDQFYPTGVLRDGRQTKADRSWAYSRYQKRNTWLDVNGNVYKNGNQSEVKTIIVELLAFCDWAENQKKNNKGESFDVAVLTFYKGQEKALREAMQKELPNNKSRYSRFSHKGITIKLATVDYFQGQEADLVFLSMVNTNRDGFMDSPNRLNVSITRARYQLVIVGHYDYFSLRSRTAELKKLALSCEVSTVEPRDNRSTRRNNKR